MPIGESVDPDASDDEVLAFIKKNTRLPEKEHQRYWELRLKRKDFANTVGLLIVSPLYVE